MIGKLVGASWFNHVLVGAVLVGLLSLCYGLGYRHAAANGHARFAAREAQLHAAHAEEMARQHDANDKAKRAERDSIAALRAANADMEAKMEELSIESAKDPDRGRIGLSAGSVRRIGKVGP